MRDLFIPALKQAESRGNYNRDVLELMLERTMDHCEATGARLTDAFNAVQASHGGFTRFYLAALREHAHLVAERAGQNIDTIKGKLTELANMEMEPRIYHLAMMNSEAKDLLAELVGHVDGLRRFRDVLPAYPDVVSGINAAIDRAEADPIYATAQNLARASSIMRQQARA